jgi:sterol desaturase/sphingolipid hydroxylase (fatty acid hydroxylase superfamily)
MTHLEAQLWPLILDLFRTCVWLVLLAVIFVPLERLFPVSPQKILRPFLTLDLVYYFLNNYLPKILIVPVMALVGWGLHFLVPSAVYDFAGGLPLWARLGLGLLVGDVGYYWCHRAMHQTPVLWRFHAVHHSAEQIDWLVNVRAHPVDNALSHLAGLIPLYALGLAQPLSGHTDIVPLLFIVIGATWSFFIHANLNWRFGWLEAVVSTPGFHRWHHTRVDHIDHNYASMAPWLDLVFGTYYAPPHPPAEYGIAAPMPTTLTGQLFEPFAPRAAPPRRPLAPAGTPPDLL